MITAFRHWKTAVAVEVSYTTTAAVTTPEMAKVHATEAILVATRHHETMGTNRRTRDKLLIGEITLDHTADVAANILTSTLGENTPRDPTAIAPEKIAIVETTVKDAITKKMVAGQTGVKAAMTIGAMASGIASETTAKMFGEIVATLGGMNAAIMIVGTAVKFVTVKTRITPSGPLTPVMRIAQTIPSPAQNYAALVDQAGGKTKIRPY